MTRSEIREKFSFIKDKMSGNPESGECFSISTNSIDTQIKNLKEGAGKLFYFRINRVSVNDSMPEINLELVSETVYLSPTKYV